MKLWIVIGNWTLKNVVCWYKMFSVNQVCVSTSFYPMVLPSFWDSLFYPHFSVDYGTASGINEVTTNRRLGFSILFVGKIEPAQRLCHCHIPIMASWFLDVTTFWCPDTCKQQTVILPRIWSNNWFYNETQESTRMCHIDESLEACMDREVFEELSEEKALIRDKIWLHREKKK